MSKAPRSDSHDIAALTRPPGACLLHQQKQATIYTSDIPRESPLFVPVQRAGLHGLLSDIVDYNTAAYAACQN
ncbi:MAG: hypothetical protein JST93_19810 [Acidobacteria bacterium]|nr:hypothetical protein [Acidobacteriota bacterium]